MNHTCVIILGLILLMAGSLSAGTPDQTANRLLSIDDAIAIAMGSNPDLRAAAENLRAAEGALRQAALLPNPELEYEYENFGGKAGDDGGLEGRESNLALSQPIELGGKRGKRRQLARLEREALRWDYEGLKLEVMAEVKRAFARLLGAGLQVELVRETSTIAETVQGTVRAKVEAGAASPIEADRAEVRLQLVRLAEKRVLLDRAARRRELALRLGLAAGGFDRAESCLDPEIGLPSLAELRDRLESSPAMERWKSKQEIKAAALALERSAAVPDMALTAGYRKFHENGARAFVMGVSLPIPIFDRNQGAIVEAAALARAAESEAAGARLRLLNELALIHGKLEATHAEVRTFDREVLPQARKIFDAVHEGYRLGKFDFLDLLDAQKELTAMKSDYTERLISLHLLVADVERLTGPEPGKRDSGVDKEKKQ